MAAAIKAIQPSGLHEMLDNKLSAGESTPPFNGWQVSSSTLPDPRDRGLSSALISGNVKACSTLSRPTTATRIALLGGATCAPLSPLNAAWRPDEGFAQSRSRRDRVAFAFFSARTFRMAIAVVRLSGKGYAFAGFRAAACAHTHSQRQYWR